MEASKIKKPIPKSRESNRTEPLGQIPGVPTLDELLSSVDTLQDPALLSGECSTDINIPEVTEVHQTETNLERGDSIKSSDITQPLKDDEKESEMPSTSYVNQISALETNATSHLQDELCLSKSEQQHPTPIVCDQNISSVTYPIISDINDFESLSINYPIKCQVDQQMETSLYPSLKEIGDLQPLSTEIGEAELLSEQQLLEFYHNDQLEIIDDFVDSFYSSELEPSYSLYDLLLAYKNACEKIQANDDLKAAKLVETHNVNERVWTISNHKVVHQGKCGCDRVGYGETYYQKAEIHPELLIQLKEAMDTLVFCELDIGLCQSVRASSLVFQIQWTISELRERFYNENNNSKDSGLLEQSSLRRALRGALSDLFHFLRFPLLHQRFRQSIINWTTQLAAILLDVPTSEDQFFLLAHILRTPSPLENWAAPLVQTFVTTPTLELKKPIDNFVAMLSMLMQPIKYRDQFLMPIIRFYEGENSWNMVSESGELDDGKLTDISEENLIELLAQFTVKPLLGIAFRYFTLIHKGIRIQILCSLVSFVGTLLKILDEGLNTYCAMTGLCKRIADIISKVVICFCTYWRLIRTDLEDSERRLMQNEVNRVMLQSIFYLTSKNNAVIRQFLVNLPYDTITENCRLRCQLLLRELPNKNATTVSSLYLIPDCQLLNTLKSCSPLVDQLGNGSNLRENDDITYTVQALASIVSHSEQDLLHFVTELIDICFLNENTRQNLYKVGSEAMAILLERNPNLLSPILRYIDRYVDHLDDYVVNILKNVPLNKCVLSCEDVTDRLGKWLIQRPVNHPASAIARLVFTSMNWSSQSTAASDENNLWIPIKVHNICAETLVKAHFVHCKQRNSLISKPLNKISRLATKCPDLEQMFDRFCWDILIKLKISENLNAPSPPNDLTAFFLYCVQKCLSCPNEFMVTGIRYFLELVNSSCHYASLVILIRAVSTFSSRIHLLTGNSTFCDCFERLLHADDSSYAYNALQIFTGGDKFPGPILTFLSSAIIHQIYSSDIKIEQRKQLTLTWLQLLTCQKSNYKWNDDKNIIFLIGRLTECAFFFDHNGLFGAIEMVQNLYKIQYQQWKKSSSHGPFSWFSSNIRPQLISSNLFSTSKWATYLLLCAEQQEFPEFYSQFYEAFKKCSSRSLEDILKKASSKSGINFSVDNLPYFRWLQLCIESSDSTKDFRHPVFTLALQQLAITLFQRRNAGKNTSCPGLHFYKCKESEKLFDEFRRNVLQNSNVHKNSNSSSTVSDIQINPSTSPIQTNALLRAFDVWISSERCFHTGQPISSYGDLPMDYLLQLIISGNMQIWEEFIDQTQHEKSLQQRANLYAKLCHLSNLSNTFRKQFNKECKNLAEFFASFESSAENLDNLKPKPVLIIDTKFPIPDKIVDFLQNKSTFGFKSFNPFASFSDPSSDTVQRFISHMEELNTAARLFLNTKDFVDKSNLTYIELFKQLYKQFERKLQITLRCGNILQATSCPRPGVHEQLVKPFEYQQEIADKMNDNRQKREIETAKLLSKANHLALTSARLEYFCTDLRKIFVSYSTLPDFSSNFSDNDRQHFLQIGLRLFYGICSNVQGDQLLFPIGMDVLSACLKKLGSTFIANMPEEQTNLMAVVLAGNPLNHLLLEHFTPHCVQPPDLLAKLYSNLSAAVRQSSTSTAALSLLRRLDIEHAGRQLPSNQFQALIPVMFENLVAATITRNSNDASLQELCLSHYLHTMFHHFPFNFTNGLRLALSGCDKHYISESLFDNISKRLNIDSILSKDYASLIQQKSKHSEFLELDAEKALECINVIENQLISSRRELNTSLFTVWSPYLEHICKLSEFFLRSYVRFSFRADAPAGIMEKELDRIFHVCLKCWSSLLEPVPMSNLPPWNSNDTLIAQKILEQFIHFLLWLPHSLYIPPDRECPESLFWNYFTSKLVNEQFRNARGGGAQNTNLSFIYSVYESKMIALNWSRFWPTLPDFGTFDQLLDYSEKLTESSNNYIKSIIVEIFVRLPWPGLVSQYLCGYHPLDATRTFHSLLLSIMAKCIVKRTYYKRSRATMCNKIKFLSDNCQWVYVKSEAIERVGTFLSSAFPNSEDWFTGHNSLDEAQQYFLEIWRQVCHVSTIPLRLPSQIPQKELEIPRKQAIYMRTQLSLLFRLSSNTIETEQKLKYYSEVLDKANFLVISADNKLEYLDFACELITFWANYFNQHQGNTQEKKCLAFIERLYSKLIEWIETHSDSPLVLLFANISKIFEKIPVDLDDQFSLGIAESCINAYFKRTINFSHNWNEISKWVQLSKHQIDHLFVVPNPRFLVLYAYLEQEKAKSDETSLLTKVKKLSHFLSNVKPKYIIKTETSFLLCVGEWQRLCINLFTFPNPSLMLFYSYFDEYIGWLHRVYMEESVSGGILSIVTSRLARRQLYSTRLKLLTNIMHLFISQNLTSSKQLPRLQRGQHVFNNKLNSFRELQNNKAYTEFNLIFAETEQYFLNSSNFCLTDADLLYQQLIEQLYPEEKCLKK